MTRNQRLFLGPYHFPEENNSLWNVLQYMMYAYCYMVQNWCNEWEKSTHRPFATNGGSARISGLVLQIKRGNGKLQSIEERSRGRNQRHLFEH